MTDSNMNAIKAIVEGKPFVMVFVDEGELNIISTIHDKSHLAILLKGAGELVETTVPTTERIV